MVNFYEELEVSDAASQDDIKKSYRRLAMMWHPDKHTTDKNTAEEKFKKINEAYETLSDQQKRGDYDQQLRNPRGGHPFQQGGMPRGFSFSFGNGFPFGFGSSPFGGNSPMDGFEHIFNQQFHPFQTQQQPPNINKQPKKCPNEEHKIKIPFKDIFQVCNKKLRKTIIKYCSQCYTKCEECKGQGLIMRQVGGNHMMRQFAQVNCNMCLGKGLIYKLDKTCGCIEGTITTTIDLTLELNPYQFFNGFISFEKQGTQPTQFLETPGDLNISVEIVDKPENITFDVNERNILFEPKCNIKDLILGTTFECPHILQEPIKIEPLSIQPDFKIEIENKGLFKDKDSRGKLIIRPNVDYTINKEKVNMERLKECFTF